jgi:hypothetical protein
LIGLGPFRRAVRVLPQRAGFGCREQPEAPFLGLPEWGVAGWNQH